MPHSAPPDEDKVHRLTDMVTEEVSLVDRAANRRKFLIVKSEKGRPMPHGAQVVAGPNGLTTGAAAPPPAVGSEETTKATAVLPKDVQDALSSCIEECLAQLEDLQKIVDKAKTTDKPEEVSGMEDILDALMGVGDSCEDAVYAAAQSMGAQPPMEQEEAAEAAAQPPQQPNQPAPPLSMGMPMGKRLELLKAQRVVRTAKAVEGARTLVEKYGRKMKKERHDRFLNALTTLQELASELAPAVRQMAQDTSKAGAPDPKKPKGKGPQAGAAETTGPDKANVPPAAMAPGKAAKAEVPAEVQKRIDDLAKQVTDLTVQLKKSAEKDAAARASIATSNAAQPEGASRAEAADDVSWPLDMNAMPDDEASPNRF